MEQVFAIVVTYNGLKWYDRCLGSLRDSEVPVSIIAIDNASTDGTKGYICSHYPEVHLIESKTNLGFAKANNIGIHYALDHGADFFFLLNQDAWVEKNTIKELLQTFVDHKDVGIASPIHLNGQYSALDFGFASYMEEGFVSDAYMNIVAHYYPLSFVNAAAWLVSKKCIETVGGFDTMLFSHYGEDFNLCQRVHYHGFRIMLNTNCTICHDREDRRKYDYKYKEITKQQLFLDRYLSLGNINHEFDFADMIKTLEKRKRRKILQLNFQAAKKVQQELECIHRIVMSRSVNKEKGLHWLLMNG